MNCQDQSRFVLLINHTVPVHVTVSHNTGMFFHIRKIHSCIDIQKLHLLLHGLYLHILVIRGKAVSAYTEMVLPGLQICKRCLRLFRNALTLLHGKGCCKLPAATC